MIRKWILTGAGLLWIVLGAGAGAGRLLAAPQDAQQKPAYTMAEYNAYQAADKEANPQQKIKLLDDFVKQYPMSTLLPYIYRDYYLTDYSLKNFAGTMEYADKQLGLGEKIDAQGRLEALVARAQAYYVASSDKAFQTADIQTKARAGCNGPGCLRPDQEGLHSSFQYHCGDDLDGTQGLSRRC